MDEVNNPKTETIVLMSSSQIAKTELLLNIIGYFIDHDPAPIFLLQPNMKPMGEAFSKDRLAPMLRDTPVLKDKVKDARSRDSGNTLAHKTFNGGHVTISGSNSPASLASRPIRILLCDEVDRYPESAGSEGDPINLASVRTTTFYNRKKVYVSTPTIKGISRIENAYEKSDMRRFYVPCPHCEIKSIFKWSNIVWDKDPMGNDLPETAHIVCEECGGIWHDHQKMGQMIKGGEWRADGEFNGTAGFHLNALYSPWVKWSQAVKDFLDAKGDYEQMKTWTNTCLGETFDDNEGDQLEEGILLARREEYKKVPDDVVLLLMSVDVQKDRLELEVCGHGDNDESWNVDYRVLQGDTTLPHVWKELTDMLDHEYEREDGQIMRIIATGVDSGYNTQMVYDYCYKHRARRVYALKGVEGVGRPIISQSTGQTKKTKRKVPLWIVGVDDAKTLVQARLRIFEQGAGYCHFPMARDEEYFLMLTAEKVVTKFRRGFPYREWQKTRPRNEAFDLKVYQLATLKILNPNWQALVKQYEPKDEEKPVVPDTVTQSHVKNKRKPAKKRGFAQRY